MREPCTVLETTDCQLVNGFINHPAIFPHIGFEEGPVDFSPWVGVPSHVYLWDGDGGMMLFHVSEPPFLGIWQCHYLFKPECAGKVDTALAMLGHMREVYKVQTFWAQVPTVNRKARQFSRKIGFQSHGFGTTDLLGEVEYFGCQQQQQ